MKMITKLMLLISIQAAFLGNAFAGKILADRMFAFTGQTLNAGDRLYSADTRYFLEMQSDCNLVIYRSKNVGQQVPIWNTLTQNQGFNCRMVMQTDGNLVVYGGNGSVLFATNTQFNNTNAVLVMQNDGNLVMYRNFNMNSAIWNSGSQQP